MRHAPPVGCLRTVTPLPKQPITLNCSVESQHRAHSRPHELSSLQTHAFALTTYTPIPPWVPQTRAPPPRALRPSPSPTRLNPGLDASHGGPLSEPAPGVSARTSPPAKAGRGSGPRPTILGEAILKEGREIKRLPFFLRGRVLNGSSCELIVLSTGSVSLEPSFLRANNLLF